MRRVKCGLIAGAVMLGTLGCAAVSPAWAESGPASASAEALASVPDERQGGVTVGNARNQATGDVLGLGYEQVVRIVGSSVVISEPLQRGGAELRRFEAGLDTTWPREDPAKPTSKALFYGGTNLADVVHHEASRIAVLGDRIFVSRLLTDSGTPRRGVGSEVSVFKADGTRTATKKFDEGYAITALDAYESGNQRYLAIGLNLSGMRVLTFEQGSEGTDALNDFRQIARHWYRPHIVYQPDQVTALKLGTDESGRLILTAGRLTGDAPALEAFDVFGNSSLWWKNYRPAPKNPNDFEWPDLADYGRLGAPGAETRALVAVAWPTLGRVSVYDAASGFERHTLDGSAAHVMRFFTGADGTGYVAVARDTADGAGSYTITTANARGELVTVREGAESGLPAAIAELAGP